MMQKVAVENREFLLRMSDLKSGDWSCSYLFKKNNNTPGGVYRQRQVACKKQHAIKGGN